MDDRIDIARISFQSEQIVGPVEIGLILSYVNLQYFSETSSVISFYFYWLHIIDEDFYHTEKPKINSKTNNLWQCWWTKNSEFESIWGRDCFDFKTKFIEVCWKTLICFIVCKRNSLLKIIVYKPLCDFTSGFDRYDRHCANLNRPCVVRSCSPIVVPRCSSTCSYIPGSASSLWIIIVYIGF